MLTAALLLVPAPARAAGPSVHLEVRSAAVSASAAQRTLALELGDLVLPPDPACGERAAEPPRLHVIVSEVAAGLTVEVWDRGEWVGRHTVSREGQPSTLGRRVALAAVELVRQLAARRARQARELERERELLEKVRLAEQREARARALALGARFGTLLLPEGAWAVGPGLGLELDAHLPLRLRVALGWLAGSLPVLGGDEGAPGAPGAPTLSMLDLEVQGLWALGPLAPEELEFGAVLGVSSLGVGDGVEVDGAAGQTRSWTARAGLSLGGAVTLSDALRLQLSVSGGTMLRRVPLALDGREASLGGGFLALSLGVLVQP